jgi:RNA polymerase sigma-70 factor (ECF subfamily)
VADFERMFSENYNLVFRFLLKLCGDASLAEELTQESFFRAYINLGRLRDPDKAPVWLCQIAKNSYYAWYNENKKTAELDEELASSAPDLADVFAQKELSREAFSRLHQLDEPYKEVFLLSVFANLSLTEISALFGKSESWARVTLYRARKIIKEKMEEKP